MVTTPTDRHTDREAVYLRMLNEHGGAVRRVADSYERDPGRRQDLVQDIWMSIWQALPSFRGECAEKTFVFRIAHNRAVNHIAHWRLRRTEPLDEADPLDHHTPDPERAATEREQRERLQAAVRALPLALRQTTVLMLEGLTHREIAEVLGVSENTVAVRLTRARGALARAMALQGALG